MSDNKQTISFNGKKITLKRKEQHLAEKTTVKTRDINKKLVTEISGFHIYETSEEIGSRDINEVPIYEIEGSKKLFIPTGELLLVFKNAPTKTALQDLLHKYQLTFIKSYTPIRIAVTVENFVHTLRVAATLEALEDIESVQVDLDSEPDYYSLTPTDILFKHQWHIKNYGKIDDFEDAEHFMKKGADAKILDAWNELGNYGDRNITIAISDNGFDLQHPDFSEPNKIVNPLNAGRPDMPIPDGRHTHLTHGTPCAGIALASANSRGTVGVCPNARFTPIHGTGNSLHQLRRIFDHCINYNVDVLSMSWGETDDFYDLEKSPEKIDEINRLLREGRNGKGTVLVVAVGNDYSYKLNYLATHPNVIAVGATTSKDVHASYSNIGEGITVCSPGGGWPLIAPKASWGNATWHPNTNNNTNLSTFAKYTHFTGTSGAAPLVAGVCALILSANPSLTADEVKRILIHTADKVGHPTEYSEIGHSVRYGFGRVNALKAVKMAKSGQSIPFIPNKKETITNNAQDNPTHQPKNEDTAAVLASVVNLSDNDATLNVRLNPRLMRANISRQLKNGDKIYVKPQKINGRWYQLANEYVSAKYVQIETPNERQEEV